MLKPKKFLPFKIIKNIDTNYGCCKYINFKFYIFGLPVIKYKRDYENYGESYTSITCHLFGLPIFHNFIKIHKI